VIQQKVILRHLLRGIASMAMLLAICLAACHNEEQAVSKAAQNAANAEHKAQAAATLIDQQRVSLARIPLPTKSLYIDVHEPNAWANPFLSVNSATINLRVLMADANPSPDGQGSPLRPASARRQELEIRLNELADALVALPPGAWHYGRVVAVAESPLATRKDRPMVRRNVEAAIQKLNDLGIVVEEWPVR
jgi:hypothetical protein